MGDLHWGHSNILKFGEGRKFSTISEMEDYIKDTLSKTLKKEDFLFDLGDLFWKTPQEEMEEVCSLFPRRTWKILGNHDKESLYMGGNPILRKYFEGVSDLLDLRVIYGGEDIQVTLSHYPFLTWNHSHWGSLGIHGHTHGSIDILNSESPDLRVDIGFDSSLAKETGSFLIPFQAIWSYMKSKTGGLSFRKYKMKYYDKRKD
jgi:calcineurin-like phosphoesterase family protein